MHSTDGVASEPIGNDHAHIERIQAEVQEIAEVLSRQSGRSIVEVWNEALSLHRVRYDTVPLPDGAEGGQ
jgi:hypothetical protein